MIENPGDLTGGPAKYPQWDKTAKSVPSHRDRAWWAALASQDVEGGKAVSPASLDVRSGPPSTTDQDIATVRWYLDKRDDRAGWEALARIKARIAELERAEAHAQQLRLRAVNRVHELEKAVEHFKPLVESNAKMMTRIAELEAELTKYKELCQEGDEDYLRVMAERDRLKVQRDSDLIQQRMDGEYITSLQAERDEADAENAALAAERDYWKSLAPLDAKDYDVEQGYREQDAAFKALARIAELEKAEAHAQQLRLRAEAERDEWKWRAYEERRVRTAPDVEGDDDYGD